MRAEIATSVPLASLLICGLLYTYWPRTPSYGSPNIESTAYINNSTLGWGVPRLGGGTSKGRGWRYRSFVSSPARPPDFSISHHGGPLADGYIFITPQRRLLGELKGTPYIYAPDGELVYSGDVDSPWDHLDFNVQDYKGRPYLTFWRGRRRMNRGYGEAVFVDEEYEEFTVTPLGLEGIAPDTVRNTPDKTASPGVVDLHELQVTDWNTLLVTAYNKTLYTTHPFREDGESWILDSLFYEIDMHSGEILFRWSAAEHVDVRTSHLPRLPRIGGTTFPYDFFHICSVQAVSRDYFLVNSRHMWTTYMVRRSDGGIEWEINGATGGDFGQLPDNGSFRWAHHARAHNFSGDSITISWFDNHVHEGTQRLTPSRGLAMQLSLPPSRGVAPKLLRNTDATTPQRYYSNSQGSYQVDLQYGNQLLCHGSDPVVLELDSAGQVLWEARYGNERAEGQSYRALKREWHATPRAWDPSLVLELDGNRTAVYDTTAAKGFVSWNGATDVESWNVYAGADETLLQHIGQAEKKGFETVFPVDVSVAACVQVGAVQQGKEVRKSNVACL